MLADSRPSAVSVLDLTPAAPRARGSCRRRCRGSQRGSRRPRAGCSSPSRPSGSRRCRAGRPSCPARPRAAGRDRASVCTRRNSSAAGSDISSTISPIACSSPYPARRDPAMRLQDVRQLRVELRRGAFGPQLEQVDRSGRRDEATRRPDAPKLPVVPVRPCRWRRLRRAWRRMYSTGRSGSPARSRRCVTSRVKPRLLATSPTASIRRCSNADRCSGGRVVAAAAGRRRSADPTCPVRRQTPATA